MWRKEWRDSVLRKNGQGSEILDESERSQFHGNPSCSSVGLTGPCAPFVHLCAMSCRSTACSNFNPEETQEGRLTPWELAKVWALHQVVQQMAEQWGMQPAEVVGTRVDAFIAAQVVVKGGGHPTERTVRQAIAKCSEPTWFPGKQDRSKAGRKRIYSDFVKHEVARVAMDMKANRQKVTPRNVLRRLPRLARNPHSGKAMSKWSLRQIFTTHCYDLTEDDPWVYMKCVSKSYLPEGMMPKREATARQILELPAGAWYNMVSIDPCASLLPKTQVRLEEQQIAALGSSRYMSPRSRFDNVNLAASDAAKRQAGGNVVKVHWTPVLCRGKIRIYVCNPDDAARDPRLPIKLNSGEGIAKFVNHVLPEVLAEMQRAYGWGTRPRTVVHDKASYMVSPALDRLSVTFAEALTSAGLRSWVGTGADSASWLSSRFSDVYPHETAISHVRRLLDEDFMCANVHEDAAHFRSRMERVCDYLNSPEFPAKDGRGLEGLCKSWRDRCLDVVSRHGGRIPR